MARLEATGWPPRRSQDPGHPGNNFAVLSPDGQQAVASRFKFFGWGLSDGQIRVHDVATGIPLGPAIRLDGIVREGLRSPSGTNVAVAYETVAGTTHHGRLALHDFTSGRLGLRPAALPGVPSAIAFSPDGNCLAAYSRGGFVTVIETVGGRVILRLRHELPGGTRQANDRILFTPDGSSLITLGEDRRVQVWDLERRNAPLPPPRAELRLGRGRLSRRPAAGHRHLSGNTRSNALMVWDLRTGRPVSPSMTHARLDLPGRLQRRRPAGADRGPRRPGKALGLAGRSARLPPMSHEDEVYGVALTPDGQWGLTACRDGNVRFWDLRLAKQVGPPIATVAASSGSAFSVTVSSDGSRDSGPALPTNSARRS